MTKSLNIEPRGPIAKENNTKIETTVYVYLHLKDDECKIIKVKTLMIKQICSWLPPWLDG